MKYHFAETGFARLYLWTAKAKYTMGILYLAYTFVYLILGVIASETEVALDLFTAIEMMFCCFFIGLAQQGIVPLGKLTKPRCAVWTGTGLLITVGFSLAFGWFSTFPSWCFVLFLVMLAMGMLAVLLGSFIELYWETKLLNRQLEKFQNKPI